jgi:biofilm PGA synthesis N-glycosyltransferase PgaC
MNSAMNRGLKLKFKWGQNDYRLGGHPLWEVFRCVYQMSRRPYVIGGLATLIGYYLALLTRRPRSVSTEFARFRGKEQITRLEEFLITHLGLHRVNSFRSHRGLSVDVSADPEKQP